MNQFTSPSEISLSDVFLENEKFCFLIGSGISCDPPSSLPTGERFVKLTLQSLIPQEEQKYIYDLMDYNRDLQKSLGDFLRFEQLMDYIYTNDKELSILDGYKDCKIPNLNHFFLANMIKKGHNVFTTNFDSLIEYAFSDKDKEDVFPIIYKDDWKSPLIEKKFCIFKLHGSLINFRTRESSKDSIQATITQISKDKKENLRLEPWKHKIFKENTISHDLIVMGYSGLDDFDVLPTLGSIKSNKRIIWINHDSNRSLNNEKIEQFPNNFKLENLDRIRKNLLKLANYEARDISKLIIININTRDLIIWLWKRFICKILPKIDEKENLFQWNLPNLDLFSQWYLVGQIFEDHSLFQKSMIAYERALSIVENDNDNEINIRRKGQCFTCLGTINKNIDNWEKALDFYNKAFKIDIFLKDIIGMSIDFNGIGRLFVKQSLWEEALEYFKKSLEINKSLKDLDGISSSLTNIGDVLFHQKSFEKALIFFEQALEINTQIGNLNGKASSLNNIGLIFREKDEFNKANKYFHKSLEVNELLGNINGKAINLTCIAGVLVDQGNLSKALNTYHQVLHLDDLLGDLKGKSTTLYNIGVLFKRLKKYNEALEYLISSIEISNEIKDKIFNKKIITITIDTIYLKAHEDENKGNFNKAIESYEKGLIISENNENIDKKLYFLYGLISCYSNLGNLNKKIEYCILALDIVEKLNDFNKKASLLNDIGFSYKELGNNEDAIAFLTKASDIEEYLGNVMKKVNIMISIGKIYFDDNEFQKSLDIFKKIKPIVAELKINFLQRTIDNYITQIKQKLNF